MFWGFVFLSCMRWTLLSLWNIKLFLGLHDDFYLICFIWNIMFAPPPSSSSALRSHQVRGRVIRPVIEHTNNSKRLNVILSDFDLLSANQYYFLQQQKKTSVKTFFLAIDLFHHFMIYRTCTRCSTSTCNLAVWLSVSPPHVFLILLFFTGGV